MFDIHHIIKKLTVSFLVVSIILVNVPLQTEAFSPQVIQKGATGDDVIELQARLQYVGYYTGKIDGVFGWSTYWAVRNFQHDYGIKIDGLVGDEMKQKLAEETKFDANYVYAKIRKGEDFDTYGDGRGPLPGWPPPGQRDPGNHGPDGQPLHVKRDKKPTPEAQQRDTPAPGGEQPGAPAPGRPAPGAEQPGAPAPGTPAPGAEPPGAPAIPEAEGEPTVGQAEESINLPDGFTQNDLKLMANAVYGEARGEPYEGQVAVAAVILNRIKHPDFPNTVSGVIFEPLAFTAVADGQIWLEPNETARRAVQDAINGWDPSGGLVYYFNPDTATSAWMFARPRVKRIGKHVFLR